MTTTAIVIGSGRSVWDDLRAIGPIGASIFAVNDMIVLAPHVDHAVSHHPEKLGHWVALRGKSVQAHSSKPGPGIGRAWPEFARGPSGSSSLLATRVALALGYEAVIVAGVPLDAGGYIWAAPWDRGAIDFARYRRGWDARRSEFLGRVTAVSGYLADLLGRPAKAMAA